MQKKQFKKAKMQWQQSSQQQSRNRSKRHSQPPQENSENSQPMHEEYQHLCSTIETTVEHIRRLQDEKNDLLQNLCALDAEITRLGTFLLALTERRDEKTKSIAKNILARFSLECQHAFNL